MTIFRSRIASVALLSLTFSIAACGDDKQQKEIDDLKKQVSDLQGQVDDPDEPTDAMENSESEIDEPSEPVSPIIIPHPTYSNNLPDLSGKIERDRMQRDIDNLRRQAELDRMNRDIERREAEEKQRKRDMYRQLGIDN